MSDEWLYHQFKGRRYSISKNSFVKTMQFIADLHVHSHYSRATSRQCNLFNLANWASVKGIQVLATGDFTHPAWLDQLKSLLEPAEPGLFVLNSTGEFCDKFNSGFDNYKTRFMLNTEISCIYSKSGRTRKIHVLVFAPDFESVDRINSKLSKIGNLAADGRPTLGLDVRNLLEIVLEEAPEGFMVPAHIWTPWFSLFGAKSGFDSIEECFEDLTDHIFALETGLSAGPGMIRAISALDRFALVSNSDCHSPSNLGREANMFDTELNYYSIRNALKSQNDKEFIGTVEFYPQEGKYYHDGHRKCDVSLTPEESKKLNNRCPVCNKPVTAGVLNRVYELADRSEPLPADSIPSFTSLIPLKEILSELLSVGVKTKTVERNYSDLINTIGTEFELLMSIPLSQIEEKCLPSFAEAIRRLRAGHVIKQPGFDGQFGSIRLFTDTELVSAHGSKRLKSLMKY